ncbi:MAG: translation initiation factor [Chthoniobacteraceae bacterium]
MRPEKQKRIAVDPRQQGLAGLGAALSGLNLGPLPPASEAPVQPIVNDPRKPKKLGRVILRRETAHRGGRTVIVVHDFPPSVTQPALEDLARDLRRAIGTGGTVCERTIEMQGDQPAKIRTFLEKLGYQVAGVS